MDEQTKKRRLEIFEERCRERSLPITVQRRLILEAVLDLESHPTADQVYETASIRMPEVSRTTVYRTLETLVRLGVITKACHPGSAVRYDARTDVHHHLVCLRCDRIADILDERLNELEIPDTSAHGFEVSDFRVQLRGICRRCSELEDKS